MFEMTGQGFPIMSSNLKELFFALNHNNIYEINSDKTII